MQNIMDRKILKNTFDIGVEKNEKARHRPRLIKMELHIFFGIGGDLMNS